MTQKFENSILTILSKTNIYFALLKELIKVSKENDASLIQELFLISTKAISVEYPELTEGDVEFLITFLSAPEEDSFTGRMNYVKEKTQLILPLKHLEKIEDLGLLEIVWDVTAPRKEEEEQKEEPTKEVEESKEEVNYRKLPRGPRKRFWAIVSEHKAFLVLRETKISGVVIGSVLTQNKFEFEFVGEIIDFKDPSNENFDAKKTQAPKKGEESEFAQRGYFMLRCIKNKKYIPIKRESLNTYKLKGSI